MIWPQKRGREKRSVFQIVGNVGGQAAARDVKCGVHWIWLLHLRLPGGATSVHAGWCSVRALGALWPLRGQGRGVRLSRGGDRTLS